MLLEADAKVWTRTSNAFQRGGLCPCVGIVLRDAAILLARLVTPSLADLQVIFIR